MNPEKDSPQVVLDGELLAASAAKVSPLGDGFLYGLGLFETIKVRGGCPVFFARHLARLRRGAAELGLAPATADDELRARGIRCLEANGIRDGNLKLVLFQGESGCGELILGRTKTYAESDYQRGFRIRTVPDRRPDGGAELKTLNYLKNIRAKRAAAVDGFDEPLFVDPDGSVLEGATTNLFIVTPAGVFTPPASAGILPGIARGIVLELGADRPVREQPIGLAQLRAADEVFVTNALLGVMPVAAIDGDRWDLRANPVTAALRQGYRQREEADG